MTSQSQIRAVDGNHPVTPPELHLEAERQILAAEQGLHHVLIEYNDDVEEILNTLVEEGPYAYTTRWTIREDGSPQILFVKTREEIRQAYYDLHSDSNLRLWQGITQYTGSWFTFYHGLTTNEWNNAEFAPEGFEKGKNFEAEVIVLFPTMGRHGITGELFWARRTGIPTDTPGARTVKQMIAAAEQRDAHFAALKNGDIDGALKFLTDGVQYGIRDYVDDDGSIRRFDGAKELRSYLETFYERYEVESIRPLQAHSGTWYVFVENQWIVRDRTDNVRRSFRMAGYFDVETEDGKAVCHIAHGTDLNVLDA